MRKITILLFLLITLSGCQKYEYIPPSYDVVKYPDKTTASTVNGYKENSSSTASSVNDNSTAEREHTQNQIYYVNIKSKKIHLPECTYAKKLKEENVSLETDLEALLSNGYEACKVCNP